MKNIHVLPTEKPSILYAKDDNYKLANSTMAMDWYISSVGYKPYNIYITSDEEIKEGDWCISLDTKTVFKVSKNDLGGIYNFRKLYHKIILTTDPDLIGVQAIDDEFLEWFVKNPSCEYVKVDNRPKVSSFEKGFVIDNPNYNKIIIPKEEPTLANMRCTCMSFEPNCFTGSCRKCGFLPKEEPKQHVEFINNNIDQLDKAIESFKQETLEEAAERILLGEDLDLSDYDKRHILKAMLSIAKWQQEQDKNKYSKEDMKEAFKNGAFKWRMHSGGKCFEEWFEQFKNK